MACPITAATTATAWPAPALAAETPRLPAVTEAASAQTVQQAAALSDAGRHAAAVTLLTEALRRHGGDAELHTALGWALENTTPACWDQARAAYRDALALDAGQVWARIGLATSLCALGDSGAARPHYATAADHAAARAEREPELLEALGWCQYCLGRLDDAADSFQRALRAEPTSVALHFDLGLVALARGDADATAHYRIAGDLLEQRSPAQRAGALRVAIDDLDDALARGVLGASGSQAQRLRTDLAQHLQAATS